jgi:hypothetical protein
MATLAFVGVIVMELPVGWNMKTTAVVLFSSTRRPLGLMKIPPTRV